MRAFAHLPLAVLVAVGLSVGILAAIGTAVSPALTGRGVGDARFGEAKAVAVEHLTAELGPPTAEQPSSGCGPRYSEVEWGDLAAEFRLGVFTGYRYLEGGLLDGDATVKRIESFPVAPRLFAAGGITLGSKLGQVRAVFGTLRTVGTNRSQAGDGLVFYDDAHSFPDPSSSHIVEMKIGTCGDY